MSLEVSEHEQSAPEDTEVSLERQFVAWVSSLSVLDQQLLRDCAESPVLPQQVMDLFRYSPVWFEGWLESDPAYSFYPEPLLRALGVR